MATFSVESGDGKLIATWNTPDANEFGDLILNNITQNKKSYATIHLNKADFAVGRKEIIVVNGDIYNIRLLTGSRNMAVQNCLGKSRPDMLQIELETRNRQIAVRLLNYNPVASAINGYDVITRFDVLIDDGNNVDYLQQFNVSDIQNGRLVIANLNGSPLVNGQNYEIVARAVNSVGPGEFCAPLVLAPSEKPGAVLNFTGVERNTAVELSWFAAPENYEYTYEIRKKLHSSNVWEEPLVLSKTATVVDINNVSTTIPRTSYIYENLVNGTSYDFKIIVISASFGSSIESSVANKIPYTLPGAMDNSKIVISDLSNNSISVTLLPPANNGGKNIINYNFKTQAGNTNYAAGLTPNLQNGQVSFIVPDLVAGSPVDFVMYANNSIVQNTNVFFKTYTQYSNPTSVTQLAAVNSTQALSTDGRVNLSWALPTNMGGAISGDFIHSIKYQPYVTDPSTNLLVLGSELSVPAGNLLAYTISGLIVGKSYSFKVQSKFTKNNVEFMSADSNVVTIIPNCAPAAPVPSIQMDVDKVNMKITWPEPNLYGLSLRTYKWKINNGAYTDVVPREQLYLPLVYGVSYTLYMKTVTILPNSADLESVESVPVLYTPYKAPGAVTNFELYPLENAIEARWEVPSFNGGYSVIKYNVVLNGELYQTITATNIKVTVTNNNLNYIAVIPVGYIGEEAKMAGPAKVKSAYAHTDPLPPTGLTLTPGDRRMKLDWVASASAINTGESDAPIISYIIFRNEMKLTGVEVQNGIVSYTDTVDVNTDTVNLLNGVPCSYRVIAKQTFPDEGKITYSDNFTSSADLKTATPFKVPDAPRNPNATGGDRTISMSWDAALSLNGLTAPATYRVSLYDSSNILIRQIDTTALSQSFSAADGVVNGATYRVNVSTRAQNFEANVSGWYESASYITANVVPNVRPLAPVGVSAVAGDRKVTLSWTAPTDSYSTRGYKIFVDNAELFETTSTSLGYVVETLPNGGAVLTNGTVYSISVRRIVQTGEQSDMVTNSRTPFGKPILVSLTRINSDKQIRAVINPNGSPLTDFIVFAAPRVYDANNTIIHKDSPIVPAQTQVTGSVTMDATQLVLVNTNNVTNYVVGAYLIAVNAAGVLSTQQQF